MPDLLKPGSKAPDFTTTTDAGQTVSLADFKGKKVILYFYPMDDTPGCTVQACGFRDNIGVVDGSNAVVLGVSPDNVESHTKFKAKFNIPFTLLVDSDHSIADKYGVWDDNSKYHIIRSHFVIDENGNIADAQVNVSPEDSVSRALKAVQ